MGWSSSAELTPDGTTFDTPVLVIVPLTKRLPPGQVLSALVHDPSTSAWVRSSVSTGEHAPAVVTPDGAHAAFLADHFSSHAVALPSLPELDLVVIGSASGVTHVCPINFDFGVWNGPPINNITGGAFSNEDFRSSIYADVFEQVLIRPTIGDGPAHQAMVDQIFASIRNEIASNADLALTPFALHLRANTVVKNLWGWAASKPANFKYTTLTNVQARLSKISSALQLAGVAAQLKENAARVEMLWVLSQAAELTRVDNLRDYLIKVGLYADPAVANGFESAALRVQGRHDAQSNQLVAALLQVGEEAAADLDTLIQAGWSVALPAGVVDSLVKAKLITTSAGAKLAGAAGVAFELALGNGDLHHRDSVICALSTLYDNGLDHADVDADGVPLVELKYISFAELAEAAASLTSGDDLGPLHWLIYQSVGPFVGNQRASTIAFWKDSASRAAEGLVALASLKYGLDTEPLVTTLDDPFPSVEFSCGSDVSVQKVSCGSDYVGCYSGPQGSWFWTYSVATPDCTATFHVTPPASGKQPVYAEYYAFCDQSHSAHYTNSHYTPDVKGSKPYERLR